MKTSHRASKKMQMIQLMGEPSVGRQQLGKCAVDSVTTDEMKGAKGTEFLEALDSAISDGQDKEVDPNGLIAQLITLDLLPGPMPDQSIDIGKLGFDNNSMIRISINPSNVAQVLANNYDSNTGQFNLDGVVQGMSDLGLPFGEKALSALQELSSHRAGDVGPSKAIVKEIQDALNNVKLEGNQYQVRLVQAILDMAHQMMGVPTNLPPMLSASRVDPPLQMGVPELSASGDHIPPPMPRPVREMNSKVEAQAAARKQGTSRLAEYGDQTKPIGKYESESKAPNADPRNSKRDLLNSKLDLLNSKRDLLNYKQLFIDGAKVVSKVFSASGSADSLSSDQVDSLNEFTSKFAASLSEKAVKTENVATANADSISFKAAVATVDRLREPSVAAEVEPTVAVVDSTVALKKGGNNTLFSSSASTKGANATEAEVTEESSSMFELEAKLASSTKRTNEFAPQVDTEVGVDADEIFKTDESVDMVKQDDVTPLSQPMVGKTAISKGINASQLERADTAVMNHANELADAVSDLIAARKPSSIKIELSPQDLGTIEVSVRQMGRRADVELRASDEGVRQSLQSHRQELVQSIESKGTSLGSLNVGHHGGNQGDQHGQNHRDTMKESLNQAAHLSRFGTTTETQSLAQPSYRTSLAGRVDYSA